MNKGFGDTFLTLFRCNREGNDENYVRVAPIKVDRGRPYMALSTILKELTRVSVLFFYLWFCECNLEPMVHRRV